MMCFFFTMKVFSQVLGTLHVFFTYKKVIFGANEAVNINEYCEHIV